jgi:hypothetical protein
MAKSTSPFAGKKLTGVASPAEISIEQRLFSSSLTQAGMGKPKETEKPKEASPQVRKPAKLSPALPDSEKVEKYTTHIEPSLVKKIQIAAIEKDINDYDVVRIALKEYFEKNK